MKINSGRNRGLLVMLLLPAAAIAQVEQTVEGAQEFLAQSLDKGIVDGSILFERTGVTRTDRHFEKVFLQGWVYDPEKEAEREVTQVTRQITRVSRHSPCITAVTGIAFTADDQKSTLPSEHWPNDPDVWKTQWSRPLASALGSPFKIEWGAATVTRSNSSVVVSIKDPKFRSVVVTLAAESQSQLDRVEYAIRFLQLNCDSIAETGF